MPEVPKEQFDHEGKVGEGDTEAVVAGLAQDYYLLVLVLVVLGLFYIFVMWILSSANADRVQRLEKLSKKTS